MKQIKMQSRKNTNSKSLPVDSGSSFVDYYRHTHLVKAMTSDIIYSVRRHGFGTFKRNKLNVIVSLYYDVSLDVGHLNPFASMLTKL
jgi:hypothetical protein